jgi:hypothetical protein
MTGVINPVVYGKGAKWVRRGVLPHIAGATLGAIVLSAVLAVLSETRQLVIGRPSLLSVAVLAGVALLVETRVIKRRFPSASRQVPRGWQFRLGASRAAFAYGATLGFGLVTVVYSPLFHVSVLASVMALPPGGQWAAAFFGLVRSVATLALANTVRGPDLASLEAALARLRAGYSGMRVIQSLVLLAYIAWFGVRS